MYQNRTLFVTQTDNLFRRTGCKLLFFNQILKWHFAFFAIGTKFFYANEKRKLLVHVQDAFADECGFGNRDCAGTFQY